MLASTAFFNFIWLIRAADLGNTDIDERIKNVTKAKNVTDDKVILVDLESFVNDNGLRRSSDNIARIPPKYYHPTEKQMNLKILDMMRQSLYATQDRMRAMDPLLNRFKNDPSLRMAFIFSRLDQLIIDMRRIYTLALKWIDKRRAWEEIVWYSHCTHKFVDVLYIVQYVIETHTMYANMLNGEEPSEGMEGAMSGLSPGKVPGMVPGR